MRMTTAVEAIVAHLSCSIKGSDKRLKTVKGMSGMQLVQLEVMSQTSIQTMMMSQRVRMQRKMKSVGHDPVAGLAKKLLI